MENKLFTCSSCGDCLQSHLSGLKRVNFTLHLRLVQVRQSVTHRVSPLLTNQEHMHAYSSFNVIKGGTEKVVIFNIVKGGKKLVMNYCEEERGEFLPLSGECLRRLCSMHHMLTQSRSYSRCVMLERHTKAHCFRQETERN